MLPHLALQVDDKLTNFTSNPDIFMLKHWPNLPSYNPNKVTFSCEFIQQSGVGDSSVKKISATTPFVETSEIAPYFFTKPLHSVQLSPSLENLFLDISGSPHFFYTALVCIPVIIETTVPIIAEGPNFNDVGPVVGSLLKGKQLNDIDGLPSILHDIVYLLIEDLHYQNLKSQTDQLLYVERILNSIDLNTTIQVQSTSRNIESHSQFKLREIKFYKGHSRLV